MKESKNIWGIREFDGDGISCPVVPANLPFQKRILLTFFRFGVCPMCVTMSLTYKVGQWLGFKKVTTKMGE